MKSAWLVVFVVVVFSGLVFAQSQFPSRGRMSSSGSGSGVSTATAPLVVTGSDVACATWGAGTAGCVNMVGANHVTDAGIVALTFAASAPTGTMARSTLTGARHGLITGDADYFSADGTTTTFVGTTITAPGVTSTTEDSLLGKLGASSSSAGVLLRIGTRQTPVGNVGTGTDVLQTINLSASGMTTTGHCVGFSMSGTAANNANTKSLAINYGSQTLVTAVIPINLALSWRASHIDHTPKREG